MNLTHTVGDIRRFINAYVFLFINFRFLILFIRSRPGTSSRSYSIQTPLPVKILDDESQTIEAAGLKNSVVVQRWT